MTHYIAIVEEGDDAHATGLWFPDVPGCFSGGDSFEEAMANASEALRSHLELLLADGGEAPRARTLAQLRADPEVAKDLKDYMVAVVPFTGSSFRPAAE